MQTDDKANLRRAALARRDAVPAATREKAADALVRAVDRLPVVAGTTCAGFWPIRSEIDPRPLMERLRQRGSDLALPAIVDETTILFREWQPDMPLVSMGFGTMGPGEASPVLEPGLILMPLAAFDRLGGRIGYGGGFYDRAIARLHADGKRPVLIGVAFACQEIESVPVEAHDQRMHGVLTEAEWMDCRR